jgi:hypothetical protein
MGKSKTQNCLIIKYDFKKQRFFYSVASDRRSGKDRRSGENIRNGMDRRKGIGT